MEEAGRLEIQELGRCVAEFGHLALERSEHDQSHHCRLPLIGNPCNRLVKSLAG